MNIVFTVIVLFSTLMLLIADPSLVLPALGESSTRAVDLTLRMLAIYAVWMGILKLCEVTGVSDKLARLLRPVIRLLYGKIPDQAAKELSINMAANVLGMGNAATPAALKAVRALDEGKKIANYAMIMLVVVNSTSLQLLPTTVIQLRQSFHSASASDIILPSLIASAASTLFGIALVFLLYRREARKPANKAETLPNTPRTAAKKPPCDRPGGNRPQKSPLKSHELSADLRGASLNGETCLLATSKVFRSLPGPDRKGG